MSLVVTPICSLHPWDDCEGRPSYHLGVYDAPPYFGYLCQKHGEWNEYNISLIRQYLTRRPQAIACPCGKVALVQVQFMGEWISQCTRCSQRFISGARNLLPHETIQVRPMEVLYRSGPTILIIEVAP